jgi:hypothetical protein
MPVLGALTQAVRQPTRFGANPLPIGFGYVRITPDQREYAPGPRLSAPLAGTTNNDAPGPRKLQNVASRQRFAISGTTRDSTGAALANCAVSLFDMQTGAAQYSVVSDGAGAFAIFVGDNATPWFLRAYKVGSPDVAGTSVNFLYGAPT